jgi:hypothetical protein
VQRQEDGEGFARKAMADQQADADQIAHLQEQRVATGGEDAAMEA